MGIAPLPAVNAAVLKRRLYDEYKVEVPITQWRDRQFLRISIQGYNNQDDVDELMRALKALLPEVTDKVP
jgi:isopenicillin-N epimerase